MTKTTKLAAVSGDTNAAVLSERMRVSAILESVEGKKNPGMAQELALRMKYAGANLTDIRVIPGRQTALDAALARIPPEEPLYILAGYTPMREFRRIMQRRGWVPPFWEE